MHSLEHLLMILSLRIRHETGNNDLAEAALTLASASHEYEPTGSVDESLAAMSGDWSRQFGKLLVGRGTERPAQSVRRPRPIKQKPKKS
jgi:hypothetical protein